MEDQYVVYNAGSGQTHIIDPVSLLLVQQIAKHPCQTDELIQEMGSLLGIEGTPESSENILGRLGQLESLGLIETVTS